MFRLHRFVLWSAAAAICPLSGVGPAAAGSTPADHALRVTPPVEFVAGVEDTQVSLNGEWDFILDVPRGFDPGQTDGLDWKPVSIPGHFSADGYGRMHKEFGVPVAYRKSISVPEAWADQRVALRFDSVEGLTTVFVNGERIDQRDTHYLPYELDITDHVEPGGEAEIVLKIAKSSITQWWRPEKGGIRRDVWLQALPPVNLASLNVTTDFDDAYEDAELWVRLKVANQSGRDAEGLRIAFTLTGPEGETIDLGEHAAADLGGVGAGDLETFEVSLPIEG
ncbi:MAG: sugar-binding domain-containing protein, partial [Planctomycetota bacterium]